MNDEPRHVFVYGTLLSGLRNHALLGGAPRPKPATVAGFRLYELGGYPGIVRSDGPSDGVRGEVCEIDGAARLARLDALEDCVPDDPAASRYAREIVTAQLDTGGECRCWIYVWLHAVDERHRIADGDYRACLARQRGARKFA